MFKIFKRKKKINTLFVSWVTDTNAVGNSILSKLDNSTIDTYEDIQAIQDKIKKEFNYKKVIIINWKIID